MFMGFFDTYMPITEYENYINQHLKEYSVNLKLRKNYVCVNILDVNKSFTFFSLI